MKNLTNSKTYREKIHNLIPGGCHTYSKGDDQFPLNAPAAISHGKGAYVWDIDGNKYLDCSMGLTSVSLGHAFDSIIDAVKIELEKGVNFQRPAYIEYEMAKAFLDLVPMHQMIKFAKNGSTVTTAATKLARAFTGRKYIAFPSDHPFYSYDDWFIGKTVCNRGIPEEIQNLTLNYKSTDLNTLADLFNKYPGQIACVISEPEKSTDAGYFNLDELIELTQRNGALFIQDEMITGFKTGFPGSIIKNKRTPDMATWGKGIANGFSFCALTGKKEVMDLGSINTIGKEKVFLISSTHGGETHSMAACIATLNEFRKKNVIEHNHKLGQELIYRTKQLISEFGFNSCIQVSSKNWMPTFTFIYNGVNNPQLRTFVLKKMIDQGVLFQGLFCPTWSHNLDDISYFVSCFKNVLSELKKIGDLKQIPIDENEICKPVFRKFN